MHYYTGQSNELIGSLGLRKDYLNGYKMELYIYGNSIFHLLLQEVAMLGLCHTFILIGLFTTYSTSMFVSIMTQ